MADVARRFHMSESHFSRMFQQGTGNTFTNFMSRLRVARACHRLTQNDKTVLSICFEAGFNNITNFNRWFLKLKGVTPSAFRRQAQGRHGG